MSPQALIVLALPSTLPIFGARMVFSSWDPRWKEPIVKFSKGGLILCSIYAGIFLVLVWQGHFGDLKNQEAATRSAIRLVTWSLSLVGISFFGSEDFWIKKRVLSLSVMSRGDLFYVGWGIRWLLNFRKSPASFGDRPSDTR
jgi:hypothetical protein